MIATSSFEDIVLHLKAGGIALIPTDTVAGLAILPLADGALPDRLYALKKRDRNKPVSWLVGSIHALDEYGKDIPTYARSLVDRFWPGPLTLVLPASEQVPMRFIAGNGTIGLRMPAHKKVLDLISEVGPLATSSANLSGRPAPRDPLAVEAELMQGADSLFMIDPYGTEGVADTLAAHISCSTVVVMDDDLMANPSGIASTVVDCTGPEPRILREGNLAAEVLRVCAETEQRR